MRHKVQYGLYSLLAIFMMASCNKREEFLGQKPNQNQVTLSSLDILGKLLDNSNIFNSQADVLMGQVSSDDYFITNDDWLSVGPYPQEQYGYIWAKDIFPIEYSPQDWMGSYVQVYYANTILEALDNIPQSDDNKTEWARIKGSALFYRGYAHFKVMQIFTLPYDKDQADQLQGIPIRLHSDINQISVRSSQQYGYDQIIADIKEAAALLPNQAGAATRPSKPAAYGMLSRIYLSLSDYENAWLYADSFWGQYNTLTDFNKLEPTDWAINPPTAPYLSEDVFHTTFGGFNVISRNTAIVDSTLYDMYDTEDLRRSCYFNIRNGARRFRGSFEFREGNLYSGITTGEILLNRAEANIRLNKIQEGINDVNTLLRKRYRTGHFTDLTATTKSAALTIVLNERRKELCFRGIRWLDLRRLNKTPEHAVTLKRILGTQEYTLPPNDPRYALPIPYNEVLVSGIPQNIR